MPHAEGGYYVIPNFAIGAFISYHTNNEYVDRQTIPVNSTSVITSDQQHSIFQLPFGAAFRYNFAPEGQFQPYVGAQLGASYSEMSTYMNVLKVYDRNWGFYVAPEIGMTVYFTPSETDRRTYGRFIITTLPTRVMSSAIISMV